MTTFSYDANNRLLTETNPLSQVTTYTYNPDGTRHTKVDGKGNTTTYSYDPNKRLAGVAFQDGTSYAFQYDARGHKTLEQSPDETRTLSYDSLGRLSTATDAQLAQTLTYGYDAAGNHTSLSYDGLTTTYVYDQANRLTQEADPDGESTFLTYDPGGRRATLAQGNGVATAYTYDAANRTLSITPTTPLSAGATNPLSPSGGEGQGEGAPRSLGHSPRHRPQLARRMLNHSPRPTSPARLLALPPARSRHRDPRQRRCLPGRDRAPQARGLGAAAEPPGLAGRTLGRSGP